MRPPLVGVDVAFSSALSGSYLLPAFSAATEMGRLGWMPEL